jgi:hypothetical protein
MTPGGMPGHRRDRSRMHQVAGASGLEGVAIVATAPRSAGA